MNTTELLKTAETSLRKATGSDRLILRQVSRRRSVSGRSTLSLEVLWAPWSLKKAQKRLGINFLSEIEIGLSDTLKMGVVIFWFPVSKTKLYHDDFFPKPPVLPPPQAPVKPRVRIKLETGWEESFSITDKEHARVFPPEPPKPALKRVRLL